MAALVLLQSSHCSCSLRYTWQVGPVSNRNTVGSQVVEERNMSASKSQTKKVTWSHEHLFLQFWELWQPFQSKGDLINQLTRRQRRQVSDTFCAERPIFANFFHALWIVLSTESWWSAALWGRDNSPMSSTAQVVLILTAVPKIDRLRKPSKREFHRTACSKLVLTSLHT